MADPRSRPRDPLFLPALGFIAGVVAASVVEFHAAELLALGLFASLCLAVSLLRRLRRAAGFSLFVVFTVLGAARLGSSAAAAAPRLNVHPGDTAILEGCVVEPAFLTGGRLRFVLEIAPGARVRVSANPGSWTPAYGDRARGVVRLFEPSEFRNPGAFSYRAWLARRSIHWVASTHSSETWTRTGTGCGSPVKAWIHSARGSLLVKLDRIYAGDRYHAAMMRGLLLGDASSIERVWVEDFRRTGTYHALVISGGHVAFFTGLFLLWIALSRSGWRAVLVLAAAVAWLYSILAGAEAPVLRSAAGFTLYVVSRFFYRRARLLNLLSLVALLFLAIDPRQLFEASFQLSFLAVAAIAALAEPVAARRLGPWSETATRLLERSPGPQTPADRRMAVTLVELRLAARTLTAVTGLAESWTRRCIAAFIRIAVWLGGSILVSACVQIALALPMVLYFHRVSWTGLTANLLVTPIVTLAIPFGFLAIATGSHWCASAAGVLLDASRWLAALHANWEFTFRVPDPPAAVSLALTASACLWAWLLRHRSRWTAAALLSTLAGLALIAWNPFPPRLTPGHLEVTAIDVGNGDSIFLGLPGGAAALIDAGGLPSRPGVPARIDTGEDVVSPYLWSRGVGRLDLLVMTHLDNDHSGGIEAILRNFRPRELWIGSLPSSPRTDRILQAARESGTTVVGLHEGASFLRGGARWHVVSAQTAPARENDTSVVLRVSHGRQSALLTGDLERPGELRLLNASPAPRIEAALLKVAHHGSRTATSARFLDAVRPAVALVSAGRGNAYGFPHEPVLRELAARGVRILRTDQEGAIGLLTDGKSWRPALQHTAPWTPLNPFGTLD